MKKKMLYQKILQAIGDICDEDCKFKVKYYDKDDITIVQLYKEPKEDVIYLDTMYMALIVALQHHF